MTEQDAGVWVTFRESSVPVRAILLGIFVNKLGAFVGTFLVLFLTHRGYTEVQAGTALGAFGAGTVLGVLVGGSVGDRLGARQATLVSMLGSAGLLIAILYVRDYWALLATVLLVGAVGQLYRPAASALLLDLTPAHRRVMISAMYRLALNLGTTVAPLIAVVLLTISYDLLLWAEAATACAYAVIAAIALPRRKVSTTDSDEQRFGYVRLLADHRYLIYLVCMVIEGAAYVQFVASMPLAMQDAGLATAWFGALITLNGVMVLTCELLVTKVVQHWPFRVVASASYLLLGAALVVLVPPWGLAVFFAATVLGTFSEIVGGPTLWAYPGIAAPPGGTTRYVGAMQTTYGLGSAVGPVLGVWMWHEFGVLSWWFWGVVCIAAAGLAWYGVRTNESVRETELVGEK